MQSDLAHMAKILGKARMTIIAKNVCTLRG